jgi:RES domain-containing protein
VKVRPNPRYSEFVAKLQRSTFRPKPWKGVTFRSVAFEYATPAHIISGEGSFRYGGRWNAPGLCPVIYSSRKPGTAVDEAYRLAEHFDLSPDNIKPRVTCGIEWELSSVIDLTGKELPAWLEVAAWLKEEFETINDGGNETLCQAFGRAARNVGVTAMFCPSARVASGMNLVVFADRLVKSEKVRVLGKSELEKHLR